MTTRPAVARVRTPPSRQAGIASAQPISATLFSRSDLLIGTEVLNPQFEVLGSAADLVVRPATGKIAYLIVARGGVSGIDEEYVPVPLGCFKLAKTGISLLVLDSSKAVMDDAPSLRKDDSSLKMLW